MTVDESIVDRDTMIATLEELGHAYTKFEHTEDAEHVFRIILRTGRDKFSNTCTFHRTMFRASVVMKTMKASMQDNVSVTKYDELAQYHQNAAIDALKIESMCKTVSEQKAKCSESDDSDSYGDSCSDISPTSSSSLSATDTTSDGYHHHSLSFE